MKKRLLAIIVAAIVIIVAALIWGNLTGRFSYIITGTYVCADSDNTVVKDGKVNDFSHMIKGKVTYSTSGGERSTSDEDFCNTMGNRQVREYYCKADNDVDYVRWVDCETDLCENGACVGCYETDEGKQFDRQGMSVYSDGTTVTAETDYCISESKGKEFYCDSEGKMASEEFECAGNEECIDGVCKPL